MVVLVGVTVTATLGQARREGVPPYTRLSTAPDGVRALWLWLQELDYPVSGETGAAFGPPPDTSVVLIVEPLQTIMQGESQILDDWVESGGTLVLAGERIPAALAMEHYGFRLITRAQRAEALTLQVPLMLTPPIMTPANARPRAYLETPRSHDFAVHLAIEEGPVVVSISRGEGQVIISTTPFPFSNAGLKEQGNPALVLNLVNATHRPGVIWFDEWHHGIRAQQADDVVGPWQWLFRTPAGRSLLYAAGVAFVAVLLRGRRFGRPVPLPRHHARRAPLEYVTAIANLKRRARLRRPVLQEYHYWLKRGLGQRYRLPPSLPDNEFVASLAEFNPELDTESLSRLLARLRRIQVSEGDMIQMAAEVASWLDDHSRLA
jgi:hypothetical protein